MRGRNHTKILVDTIVSASVADEWESAREEWEIYRRSEDLTMSQNCICGHEGLRHLFWLRNTKNGCIIGPIGSSCIRKFEVNNLSAETDLWMQAFRLLDKAVELGRDNTVELKSPVFTRKLLYFLYDQGALSNNRHNEKSAYDNYLFLIDMFNARKRTVSQEEEVLRIIRNYIYPWLRNLYRETQLSRQ